MDTGPSVISGGLSFGNLLKRYRQEAGLTQRALATHAHLSVNAIAALESGRRRWPHGDTIALLTEALKLSPAQHVQLAAAARRHPADSAAYSPPLGTLSASAPLTPLVGREREEAAAVHLLCREEVRLLTLVGPPGVGKTRLALQVAGSLTHAEAGGLFADGVCFVALAPIRDPALVLPTIAHTLGLREAGAVPLATMLSVHLRERALLLVIDNFEQVLAAGPALAGLLGACPRVTALVTSRTRLHVRGEHELDVPPLALPDPAHLPPIEELTHYAAVALFLQRARAVLPTFALTPATAPAVVGLCRRLDGLPLAIELAAARIKVLPPQALLARLDRGFGRGLAVLGDGAQDLPERQRTLRSAIAWSERLLPPEHQRLFRRLAVFRSGWTLEAVDAICAAPSGAEPLGVDVLDGLAALVDGSLVRQGASAGEPWFGLLETLREYAWERLAASGEAQSLRRAHGTYYATFAEQGELCRWVGKEKQAWLRRLAAEHDNLRAALGWAVERGALERGAVELGLRLAGALPEFWFLEGYASEGRRWIEGLLRLLEREGADRTAKPGAADSGGVAGASTGSANIPGSPGTPAGDEIPARVLAKAFLCAGDMARRQGDDQGAIPLLERALALARAAGDLWVASDALSYLDVRASQDSDPGKTAARMEEALALARQVGDPILCARRLAALGQFALARDDLQTAAARMEEALTLVRQVDDLGFVAQYLTGLARVLQKRRELARAQVLLQEALAVARDQRDGMHGVELALWDLGVVAAIAGQGERAARLLGAADALWQRRGVRIGPGSFAEREQATAPVRASMGEVAWAAAYAAGQALSLEVAIAMALSREEVGDPTER